MNNAGDKPSDSQFISFQDFSPINRSGGAGQAQLDVSTPDNQTFVSLPNDNSGFGMINDLQGMPAKENVDQPRSFWTVEYYQKFFDVDTTEVVDRISRSIIPRGGENYLESEIRRKPDLYGPFWICVTLVFSIAISGNLANYLETANSAAYHWKYDFHVVSYAATAIFTYAWLLPLALWAALKWSISQQPGNDENELIEPNVAPGILELLCRYGYSLAIYIPIAFLWTIQIEWLRWSLVAVAALTSGGILLRSLSSVIAGKHKVVFAAVILGMHFLLAAGFMLYFFHGRTNVNHVMTSLNHGLETVTVAAPVVAVESNSSIKA